MAGLTGHLQRTAGPAFDVEDLKAPRDNVLVFYGAGGIGKTTSRTLEAALTGAEQRPQRGEPPSPGSGYCPYGSSSHARAGTSFKNLVLAARERS
ncbi:hypothetical protein [Streptomyces sp. NPDC058629]|uniref:hypothetical protein n=1 Tax=Streptomyces sp. NPDC058629 TaxID=3346565 RepID=UPI003661471C